MESVYFIMNCWRHLMLDVSYCPFPNSGVGSLELECSIEMEVIYPLSNKSKQGFQ